MGVVMMQKDSLPPRPITNIYCQNFLYFNKVRHDRHDPRKASVYQGLRMTPPADMPVIARHDTSRNAASKGETGNCTIVLCGDAGHRS